MEVLSGYNKDYRSMIDNLCEVVLGNLIGHMLAGKDLSASDLNQEEYERLQEMVRQEELGALREKLKKVINEMVEKFVNETDVDSVRFGSTARNKPLIMIQILQTHCAHQFTVIESTNACSRIYGAFQVILCKYFICMRH